MHPDLFGDVALLAGELSFPLSVGDALRELVFERLHAGALLLQTDHLTAKHMHATHVRKFCSDHFQYF